ncbi:MAG: DoxX family protein [Nitriliruptoraceae bacterium]
MHRVTWVLQVVLAIYFVATGITHFVVPPGLPAPMEWMYDLSTPLHLISGTVEILGGLGLVLPALARRSTALVPAAAAGLGLVMVGAFFWHLPRGETQSMVSNVVLLALLAVVAVVRWRVHPLGGRARGSALDT